MTRYTGLIFSVTLFLLCTPLSFANDYIDKSEKGLVTAQVLAEGLDHPWALAFLPDGNMLVTERGGRLKLLNAQGRFLANIRGLPDIAEGGQGGLLDVVVHPQFESNSQIFISYVARGRGGKGTDVARAELRENRLHNVRVLFQMKPKSGGSRHFGSRLLLDGQGHLLITLGDRGERERAQDVSDHAGSVIRITEDGLIPSDNPDFGGAGDNTVFSIGHRNIQGAFLHPETGQLWAHEHGPQGGDELNIVTPGNNYGWPVITYGVNYGSGSAIGEGTEKPGMQQPLYYWVPSIAPSGMTFYNGNKFPQWQGDLLIGSLKFRSLVRLEIQAGRITHEERLFEGDLGRIRDVRTGPDGYVYLLTDAGNGRLIRLEPG